MFAKPYRNDPSHMFPSPYSKPMNVYADNFPHYFKRQLQDAVFYTSAANTVSVVDATGSAPSWLSLGASVPDQGGVSNTLQYGFSISPALSYVTNAAEFTNLFQQYQLLGLGIQVSPIMGSSLPGIVGQIPTLFLAVDYNDATAPANFAAIQQNDSVKNWPLKEDITIEQECRPLPAVQMYGSALATAYATPSKDMWLDTTAPSNTIPHFAFKGYIRNWVANAANQGIGMRIVCTLFFRCRGSH